MKTRNVSSLGSLHPILFFACIYAIALFFSIFICSALFYSCNTSSTDPGTIVEAKKKTDLTAFATR